MDLLDSVRSYVQPQIIDITIDLFERRQKGEDNIKQNIELYNWIEKEMDYQDIESKKITVKKETKSYEPFNDLIDKIIV